MKKPAEFLTDLPRNVKRILLIASDSLIITIGLWLAYFIRLGSLSEFAPLGNELAAFVLGPVAVISSCYVFGLYDIVTRYSGFEIVGLMLRSVTLGVGLFLLGIFLMGIDKPFVPRSVPIIFWSLSILGLISSRYCAALLLHGNSFASLFYKFLGLKFAAVGHLTPIIIYGAGSAGRQVAGALKKGKIYAPVAFIDEKTNIQNTVIDGLKVFSPKYLEYLIKETKCEKLLLAIPSANAKRKKQIIDSLEHYSLHILSMPGLDELATGRVRLEEIRDIPISDILGRAPVEPIPELLEPCIAGKSVMVTGAGGSIGSELCRQILAIHPERLILLDHSESLLYSIHEEMLGIQAKTHSSIKIHAVLGDVTDFNSIFCTIREHKIETLYHAAAYKHVPLVEENCTASFRNNIVGTLYCAQAAALQNVKNFILVSTDKAVRPTNFMGATKRFAEIILQALAQETRFTPIILETRLENSVPIENLTIFTIVRFGNVLDSSGSVVPKFRKQLKQGGPLTVTHKEITRYFMSIPEAAQLVIQAGTMGIGGDVFLLDMGDPLKIDSLAKKLVRLHGMTVRDETNPEGDIEIFYTGLRPGEKLYEELLVDDDACTTKHPKIFVSSDSYISWADLCTSIKPLLNLAKSNKQESLKQQMATFKNLNYTAKLDSNEFESTADTEVKM